MVWLIEPGADRALRADVMFIDGPRKLFVGLDAAAIDPERFGTAAPSPAPEGGAA